MHTKPPRRDRRRVAFRNRPGNTLMELVVASILMGVILVPAVQLLRLSLQTSRKIETSGAMLSLATGVLEKQMALGAINFTELSTSGDFSAEGYPNLRYTLTRSTRTTDCGRPGVLMAILVTVWRDDNGDRAQGANEFKITLANKVAKLASYTAP